MLARLMPLAGRARRHADVIERFGRFPHYNAMLGRESSNEERAFFARAWLVVSVVQNERPRWADIGRLDGGARVGDR
jgi:hypothetical protein